MDTIEAIYENGLFRPIGPVNLPEGTRVRIETPAQNTDVEDRIQTQLLPEGFNQNEIHQILQNFGLLWESYETLSKEQVEELEQARLDQMNLFSQDVPK